MNPFSDDTAFWNAVYGTSTHRAEPPPSAARPIAWAAFASEFLDVCRVEDCAAATLVKHRQVLRAFGSLDGVRSTADLTPRNVGAFKLAVGDRSPATVKGLLSYLRRQASYAESRRYIESSPFRALSRRVMPSTKAAARKIHHRPDEIARVLGSLAPRIADWEVHRLYAVIATAAFTGARKNEILHLYVADLDLAARTLEISDRRRLKRPSAARVLAMPDALAEILETWTARVKSPWLFPGVAGRTPWTAGPAGRKPLDRLKLAGVEVGVRGFTFQSLRHTWATLAAEHWRLGELVIQDVLGHTTPKTQRHYRHRDPALLYQAVKSLRFEEARA